MSVTRGGAKEGVSFRVDKMTDNILGTILYLSVTSTDQDIILHLHVLWDKFFQDAQSMT